MAATERVNELFDDARHMQAEAMARLADGDVRDAAEKAWCATKSATEALILARTGQEPNTPATDHCGDPLPGVPGPSLSAPERLLHHLREGASLRLLLRRSL